MNKNIFLKLILLFLVLASLVSFSGCGEKSTIIESDDGAVALEVPKGALPEEVALSDLSLTKMSDEELPVQIEEGISIGYRLEPEGTEFLEPVILVSTIDMVDDMLPNLYLMGDDKFEPIQEAEIEIDSQNQKITTRSKIPHFSYWWCTSGRAGSFITMTSTSEAGFVDDPIVATVTVKTDTEPRVYGDAGGGQLVADSVMISGVMHPGEPNHVVAPKKELQNRPPKTNIRGNEYTIPGKGYYCDNSGTGFVQYKFNVTWDEKGWLNDLVNTSWVHKDITRTVIVTPPEFKCKSRPLPEPKPKCGDYKINQPTEECDNFDFGGKKCEDLGYDGGGQLVCDDDCRFDTSECIKIHEISCNENTWEDETGEWKKWVCKDDCPENTICFPETCTCKQIAKTEEKENEITIGIPIGGSFVPVHQVVEYTPAQCPCCDENHWHAKDGTVTTLDGKVITDPYKDCGLGKVSDMPKTEVEGE